MSGLKWFNKKYGFAEDKTHTRQDVVKITNIKFKDINGVYSATIMKNRLALAKLKKYDYSKPQVPSAQEKKVAMEAVYLILKNPPEWWKKQIKT